MIHIFSWKLSVALCYRWRTWEVYITKSMAKWKTMKIKMLDNSSTFQDLFDEDNSLTTYLTDIQALATFMRKVKPWLHCTKHSFRAIVVISVPCNLRGVPRCEYPFVNMVWNGLETVLYLISFSKRKLSIGSQENPLHEHILDFLFTSLKVLQMLLFTNAAEPITLLKQLIEYWCLH